LAFFISLMIGDVILNKDGTIDLTLMSMSAFQPPEPVAEITKLVRKDYEIGYNILHRSFEEFNNKSLIERMNIDQRNFNSWVQPKTTDPTKKWQWPGIRPIVRGKLLSIAAHVIALMLYPEIVAQNDKDEMDKKTAEIMRYLIEWLIKNSDYEMSFLYGVVAALINPVAYLEAEYVEAVQTIRKRNADGTITYQEMIDEVISGFQANNIPADEILIANPYEYYIQRQRFIIRKKFVDYDEAKSIYGKHPNFVYVKPGIKVFFEDSSGLFYEQKMTESFTQCGIVVYKNRREDLEIPFVNGIYMGAKDPANNPIGHRDYRGAPKYNLVKLGYHPIDEKRFYFFKSAAFEAEGDQELASKMYRIFIDASQLEGMPPGAAIGGKKIGSNIMYPGAITNLPKDSDMKFLAQGRNLNALMGAIKMTEESLDRNLLSKTMEGQLSEEGRTLGEIARAERNAKISLGIFGKMVAAAVKEFGELMIDIIINKLTVAHVEETTGGIAQMTYKTFMLPNQTEKGRTITRKIKFDGTLVGSRITKKEARKMSYKILKEQGGLKAEQKLSIVNPYLFRKRKFLVYVEPTSMLPKNEIYQEMLKFGRFDRLVNNPYTDQEQLTRDLLIEPWAHGETDKYMLKKEDFLRRQILATPGKTTKAGAAAGAEAETASSRSLGGLLKQSAV